MSEHTPRFIREHGQLGRQYNGVIDTLTETRVARITCDEIGDATLRILNSHDALADACHKALERLSNQTIDEDGDAELRKELRAALLLAWTKARAGGDA